MKKKNVLFLLMDGLRADRVSLCPFLSSLLQKGVHFSNMITAAPYTVGSVHSLLTGLYPYRNGVNGYYRAYDYRKDTCKNLGQYLEVLGYITGWNMFNTSLAPQPGFDLYSSHDEMKDDLFETHTSILDSVKDKPFCLILQYSKMHASYVNSYLKSCDEFGDIEKNTAAYNAALGELDSYVKKMYAYLEKSGLLEDTIVVIHNDHGTGNGEKEGERCYGSFLYDTTIKIFCSMLIPGMQPCGIASQVRTIDIMPTLLELLDVTEDASFEKIQGKSLMPLITGSETKDRVAFSETGGLGGPWPSPERNNVFSMRIDGFKMIKTPAGWELYNLKKDPSEQDNLVSKNKALVSVLKPRFQKHLDEISQSM
ncbi:MAG: sulfatase-like hydrolase/transferase [Nanoarchaeota archaeon]|nr:sulfatase-like hydrolase/transferase [Nanoarchaeota archaeon]